MSNTNEVDLNEGVQIILARMKTNPEEFFDDAGKWRWIYKETLREVMTEIEKAALFEGLKQVRRMEITAKAAATVLRDEEQEKREEFERAYGTPNLVRQKGISTALQGGGTLTTTGYGSGGATSPQKPEGGWVK